MEALMNKEFVVQRGGQIMVKRCRFARTFTERLFGLIPRKTLAPDEALLFQGSCQQMHSFFMRFPIEVIFLDRNKTVLRISDLKPWRMTAFVPRAHFVLEVAPGTKEKYQLATGHTLEFPS
jgi:uncharacterized membrane protein (UPF0127 family)